MALLKSAVEKPSDYDGVNYITIDAEGGWQLKLGAELRAAGLNVDLNKVMSPSR